MSHPLAPPGTPEDQEHWTDDGVTLRLPQAMELTDAVWALPGLVILGLLGFVLGFGFQGIALMPALTYDQLVESGQLQMMGFGAAFSVGITLLIVGVPWLVGRLLRLRNPVDLKILKDGLHIGEDDFVRSEITDVTFEDGEIRLTLSDGNTWESIAFNAKDPVRVRKILRQQLIDAE